MCVGEGGVLINLRIGNSLRLNNSGACLVPSAGKKYRHDPGCPVSGICFIPLGRTCDRHMRVDGVFRGKDQEKRGAKERSEWFQGEWKKTGKRIAVHT